MDAVEPGLADYLTLIDPPKPLHPVVQKGIDAASLALPTVAAVLAISGGICAFHGWNAAAAILGTVGGAVSALGVIFTGWASRLRDQQLRTAYAVGSLGVDMADRALSRDTRHF